MSSLSSPMSAYSEGGYPLLIKQLLLTPLSQAPEQEIVYRDVSRYTYRTLRERIGRLATLLASRGVVREDTVAVLDWDSHRYLECFFAIPMMGAVLQTVNVRLSPEQIQYTLEHAGPKVLLIHRDFLDVVSPMLPVLESVSTVIIMDDDQRTGADCYETLMAQSPSDFKFEDFSEDTRATLFYTTGTTGLPKGVYFSHRQIVLHTLAVTAAFAMPSTQGRFHCGDVYMPITPMFHVHAWGMPYVATMMGVKQVYPGRYTAGGLLELRTREGVTFSHCVPTILHMLLEQANATGVDLAQWKVVVGGSALPSALVQRGRDAGMDVFAGYGMSETCPFITSAHLDESMLNQNFDLTIPVRTATGRALPLVDLQIVEGDMTPVEQGSGKIGEIVVRAPWLTPGYLGDNESSQELWRGGYLHTGDVGTVDAAGYLRISDRLKDVIKTGGEWVSSYALEDLICRHPQVSEAAVIGIKDAKWGERPMALVVLKTTADDGFDIRDIQRHLHVFVGTGQISKYAVPDVVHFVDELPRTSVGKYDKKIMRKRYGNA